MRVCSVSGCGGKHNARGFCNTHYAAERKAGRLPIKIRPAGATLERDADGRKQCNKCAEWLPESDYNAHGGTLDRLFTECKKCWRMYSASRWPTRRARRYNLSLADISKMGDEQGWQCVICGCDISSTYVIDHDHSCCPGDSGSCGRCVRGLLCPACNTMIGYAKDEVATLVGAIAYLQKFREN